MTIAFLRSRLVLALLALTLLVLVLVLMVLYLSILPVPHHWILGTVTLDPNVITHNH